MLLSVLSRWRASINSGHHQHLPTRQTFQQLPPRLANALGLVHPQSSCRFKLQLLPMPQGQTHLHTGPTVPSHPVHMQQPRWVPILTVSPPLLSLSAWSLCWGGDCPQFLGESHYRCKCGFGMSVVEESSGSSNVTILDPLFVLPCPCEITVITCIP